MREWEIGAVENIHGALPYIRFAPILALVGVGVNRIGKHRTSSSSRSGYHYLAAGNCPDGEKRMPEQLDFLQSLAIPIVPRGATTRH